MFANEKAAATEPLFTTLPIITVFLPPSLRRRYLTSLSQKKACYTKQVASLFSGKHTYKHHHDGFAA